MSGWKRKRLEALDNENIKDVHLVGTDGKEVPCCRAYLAPISPVFESMFYLGFKEQKTDKCSLDFHSLVISMIVKYCYCGEVDMDLIFSKNRSIEEEAVLLVELREAGRFFEIEDLSSAAEAKIGDLVFQKGDDKNKYQYASVFLTELFKRDGDNNQPLGLLLFEFAVQYTMKCFGPRAAENNNSTDTYLVHPSVLSKVLGKHEGTYAIVKCIQTWFFLEKDCAGNGYTDEEKRNLIKIAEDIDLTTLPTKQLADITPCSLFSSEKILAAFVHHCKTRDIITETPRPEPRLHVSGAGMESLNGHYVRTPYQGRILNVFYKEVQHKGLSCFSIIHRKNEKWLMSISKHGGSFIVNGEDDVVDGGYFQMHVYESLPTEDPKLPPFSGWKCSEGPDPAPFVACIYYAKTNATTG